MKKVRYYSSFTDDFEQTANEDYILPSGYNWVRKDIFSQILSAVIYFFAVVFSFVYCGIFLRMRVRGRKNLKGVSGGFYIYGNHTQPVGDVFIPALCVLPKRIYTIVSTANYGIPFLGKILPFLGALPTVNTFHGIKELNKAMEYRLKNGNPIVIYPEAHVWSYYTGIRPFPETSFKFPAKFNTPAFAMTVTYKKTKFLKRPIMEVFLDGPFYPTGETDKEKAKGLHDEIYSTMLKRSKNSDCEYIEYREKF